MKSTFETPLRSALWSDAAPAGGPFGGRGCLLKILAFKGDGPQILFPKTQQLTLILGMLTVVGAIQNSALAETLDLHLDPADPVVPSGQYLRYFDTLMEPPEDKILRVRFLAPEIKDQGRSFEEVAQDMEYLCQEVILPHLDRPGLPEKIIVSFMAEPVEFGIMAPKVTQYFESYKIEADICIWDFF